MTRRKPITIAVAVILALLVAGGIGLLVRQAFFKPKSITAYFTSATAIYPGDEVRVSGVKVGTIKSIQAQGTKTNSAWPSTATMPIPANAQAITSFPRTWWARATSSSPHPMRTVVPRWLTAR